MSAPRRRFGTDQKATILKRYLVDKVPISDLCDPERVRIAKVLKLFGSAWICRIGVVSEGGRRQHCHRPILAHNPWVGARVGSHRSPIFCQV